MTITRKAAEGPREEELHARLARHLVEKPGQEEVAQAWDSYLSALLEWGLLQPEAYFRLSELLPLHDRRVVEDILLGFDGDASRTGIVAQAAADMLAEAGRRTTGG